MSTKIVRYTANDTFPTTLTLASAGVPTNITGYAITMDIAYTPPLAKTAIIIDAVAGVAELQWVAGDLKAGDWSAKVAITNASGKKISTEFITLKIEEDITP